MPTRGCRKTKMGGVLFGAETYDMMWASEMNSMQANRGLYRRLRFDSWPAFR